MKKRLLMYLVCRRCGQPFELQVFEREGEEILSGCLQHNCGAWYPIIMGVPRILDMNLLATLVIPKHGVFFKKFRDQLPPALNALLDNNDSSTAESPDLKVATARSFGYEWKQFDEMTESFRQNFLNYVQPFTADDFEGKVVLDAGCGNGRHTYWSAQFGSQDVIGIDLSEAVDVAEENCRRLPNAHIIQADIYNLPFARPFDFVMSIGVLHHLPHPENGFRSILSHVKKAGTILIWVYGRKNNNTAVYFYEPLRFFTRRLPKGVLLPLCHPFAGAVHVLNRVSDWLEKIPAFRKIAHTIPFQYYRKFPYRVKLNDAFDVLATPKSRYYRISEIDQWFQRAGLLHPRLEYLRKKSIIAYATDV